MQLEKIYTNDLISSYNYNLILNNYCLDNNIDNNIDINNIPSKRGKSLTKEQKKYKKGYEYLIKLVEYE